jgi:hypothetical protein
LADCSPQLKTKTKTNIITFFHKRWFSKYDKINWLHFLLLYSPKPNRLLYVSVGWLHDHRKFEEKKNREKKEEREEKVDISLALFVLYLYLYQDCFCW